MYAPRGHRGLATDCSEPGPGQNPGQMQAGGWQWLLVSLNTAEEGVARCESPGENVSVTLSILSASSTHHCDRLSNFLLPPMPPLPYHKLWFEMLLIAAAEISLRARRPSPTLAKEGWWTSTSSRRPGCRMARWSPWRSSRARWCWWRTRPPCEAPPPGTSRRWTNCAQRWSHSTLTLTSWSIRSSLKV